MQNQEDLSHHDWLWCNLAPRVRMDAWGCLYDIKLYLIFHKNAPFYQIKLSYKNILKHELIIQAVSKGKKDIVYTIW